MRAKAEVYVLADDEGNIIRLEGGYSLPTDVTGWVKIAEGYGDRYNLAQTHYLDGPLLDTEGRSRYKLVDGSPVQKGEHYE